jgi:hypothetical protein
MCTLMGLHTIGLQLKNVTKSNHMLFLLVHIKFGVWIVKSDMFWTCWLNKIKFCQEIMMSCVIIFEIWIVLGFSLNTIIISWVLVHLHWIGSYCDSPCSHAKGLSSNIHPIISCSQTISLPISWHVGRSMCLCQDIRCSNKRLYRSNNGIKSTNIHLKQYFLMQMDSFHIFFKKTGVEKLVKFSQDIRQFKIQIFCEFS